MESSEQQVEVDADEKLNQYTESCVEDVANFESQVSCLKELIPVLQDSRFFARRLIEKIFAKEIQEPETKIEKIMELIWLLFNYDTEYCVHKFNWCSLVKFLSLNDNTIIHFFAIAALRIAMPGAFSYIPGEVYTALDLSDADFRIIPYYFKGSRLSATMKSLTRQPTSAIKQFLNESPLKKLRGVECKCGVESRNLNIFNSEQYYIKMATAIYEEKVLVVYGPGGCGKSWLLRSFAHSIKRCCDLVAIQLSEQMDVKACFGGYVCTEVPGEFSWQLGAIGEAAKMGRWLLLEDVDCAPVELLHQLAAMIENRQLAVDNLNGNFELHNNFRLIFTSSADYEKLQSKIAILHKYCYFLEMKQANFIELASASFEETTKNEMMNLIFSNLLTLPLDAKISPITLRSLLKMRRRLESNAVDALTEAKLKDCFLDVDDCFLAAIQSKTVRGSVRSELAAKFGKEIMNYEKTRRPSVQLKFDGINIGRVYLEKHTEHTEWKYEFVYTSQACNLLEKLARAVSMSEPFLLVGETGCGKTAAVQFLAERLGVELTIINMSQQSEISDLIGGFRPCGPESFFNDLLKRFNGMKLLSCIERRRLTESINKDFQKKDWKHSVCKMEWALRFTVQKTKPNDQCVLGFLEYLQKLINIADKMKRAAPFRYVQASINCPPLCSCCGALAKAVELGKWLLIDEINMASPEHLNALHCLLDCRAGDQVLLDPSQKKMITVHENFRLIACMNPATDVGKRELNPGLRSRFTEMFVDELDNLEDLRLLTKAYLARNKHWSINCNVIESLVKFFVHIKSISSSLSSGFQSAGPCYTLRTYCRALMDASENRFRYTWRSLYEAFCLSFLTELDASSYETVKKIIFEYTVRKCSSIPDFKSLMSRCTVVSDSRCVAICGYHLVRGSAEVKVDNSYVLTDTVKRNLEDLCRVVSSRKFPILLQGETSVGKTSLINYLANCTGNVCMRINNHQNTDIQEYVGSYVNDTTGQLVFVEGPLVKAMRNGHWIILDELNLADSDVLESLNRVLDDNRELFIMETQEVVKAHPNFQIFATQNPPGLYGGRKSLSRAFRNRFVQMNFGELPYNEIETILRMRCDLPLSYASKMVAVMRELQAHRSSCSMFAGREGYITLRDLFRWGDRFKNCSTQQHSDFVQYLAEQGYFILAGRCRRSEDEKVVIENLEACFKVKIDLEKLFHINSPYFPLALLDIRNNVTEFAHICWTKSIVRSAVLLGQALQFNEPTLLVGDTGCGKTTLCQMFAKANNCSMNTVNCHMSTEAADFVGRLMPASAEHQARGYYFYWSDGPLVKSMKKGEYLLIDEISLAEDAVIERLNSVLEPERTLTVYERVGCTKLITVHSAQGFNVLATMNPGGDYGKRELSRALRNRFTEIWCKTTSLHEEEQEDMVELLSQNLPLENNPLRRNQLAKLMLDLLQKIDSRMPKEFSMRDVIAWLQFIKANVQMLGVTLSIVHGALATIVDSFGAKGAAISVEERKKFGDEIVEHLLKSLESQLGPVNRNNLFNVYIMNHNDHLQVGCFKVAKGNKRILYEEETVTFGAPGMRVQDFFRLARALSVQRPILIQGSPGVGKSTLVMEFAALTGHEIIRINLSEQTDLCDLFGSEFPVMTKNGRQIFAWLDGPLLAAVKKGYWVLLDEMNLASQTVLEGLNACFDHRGEITIPELGKTFSVGSTSTRFFACQNPYHQGGNRKALPRSFVSRFTVIHLNNLTESDQLAIMQHKFTNIEEYVLKNMVTFNSKLDLMVRQQGFESFANGNAEFNLRDLIRWGELISTTGLSYEKLFYTVYAVRMRNHEERMKVMQLFVETTKKNFEKETLDTFVVTNSKLYFGDAVLDRRKTYVNFGMFTCDAVVPPMPLASYYKYLMRCIQGNMLAILVGKSMVGKTMLVKTLSVLCRQKLTILNLTPETDASELLGTYEQETVSRSWIRRFARRMKVACEDLASELRYLNYWICLERVLSLLFELDNVQQLNLKQCKKMLEKLKNISDPHMALTPLKRIFTKSLNDLEDIFRRCEAASDRVRFVWVESPLLVALRQGHWLLVENVNLCNPAVLDRLNSLFEPSGQLTVGERGLFGDQLSIYKPHKQFRAIFTMDPKYGEISRSMRNRAIEIYIPENVGWHNLYESENGRVEKLFSMNNNFFTDAEWKLNNYEVILHSVPVNILSTFPKAFSLGRDLHFIRRVCAEVKQNELDSSMMQIVLRHYCCTSTISDCDFRMSCLKKLLKECNPSLLGMKLCNLRGLFQRIPGIIFNLMERYLAVEMQQIMHFGATDVRWYFMPWFERLCENNMLDDISAILNKILFMIEYLWLYDVQLCKVNSILLEELEDEFENDVCSTHCNMNIFTWLSDFTRCLLVNFRNIVSRHVVFPDDLWMTVLFCASHSLLLMAVLCEKLRDTNIVEVKSSSLLFWHLCLDLRLTLAEFIKTSRLLYGLKGLSAWRKITLIKKDYAFISNFFDLLYNSLQLRRDLYKTKSTLAICELKRQLVCMKLLAKLKLVNSEKLMSNIEIFDNNTQFPYDKLNSIDIEQLLTLSEDELKKVGNNFQKLFMLICFVESAEEIYGEFHAYCCLGCKSHQQISLDNIYSINALDDFPVDTVYDWLSFSSTLIGEFRRSSPFRLAIGYEEELKNYLNETFQLENTKQFRSLLNIGNIRSMRSKANEAMSFLWNCGSSLEMMPKLAAILLHQTVLTLSWKFLKAHSGLSGEKTDISPYKAAVMTIEKTVVSYFEDIKLNPVRLYRICLDVGEAMFTIYNLILHYSKDPLKTARSKREAIDLQIAYIEKELNVFDKRFRMYWGSDLSAESSVHPRVCSLRKLFIELHKERQQLEKYCHFTQEREGVFDKLRLIFENVLQKQDLIEKISLDLKTILEKKRSKMTRKLAMVRDLLDSLCFYRAMMETAIRQSRDLLDLAPDLVLHMQTSFQVIFLACEGLSHELHCFLQYHQWMNKPSSKSKIADICSWVKSSMPFPSKSALTIWENANVDKFDPARFFIENPVRSECRAKAVSVLMQAWRDERNNFQTHHTSWFKLDRIAAVENHQSSSDGQEVEDKQMIYIFEPWRVVDDDDGGDDDLLKRKKLIVNAMRAVVLRDGENDLSGDGPMWDRFRSCLGQVHRNSFQLENILLMIDHYCKMDNNNNNDCGKCGERFFNAVYGEITYQEAEMIHDAANNFQAAIHNLTLKHPENVVLENILKAVDSLQNCPSNSTVATVQYAIGELLRKAVDWNVYAQSDEEEDFKVVFAELQKLYIHFCARQFNLWENLLDQTEIEASCNGIEHSMHVVDTLIHNSNSPLENVVFEISTLIKTVGIGWFVDFIKALKVQIEIAENISHGTRHHLLTLVDFFARYEMKVKQQIEIVKAPFRKEISNVMLLFHYKKADWWRAQLDILSLKRQLVAVVKKYKDCLCQSVGYVIDAPLCSKISCLQTEESETSSTDKLSLPNWSSLDKSQDAVIQSNQPDCRDFFDAVHNMGDFYSKDCKTICDSLCTSVAELNDFLLQLKTPFQAELADKTTGSSSTAISEEKLFKFALQQRQQTAWKLMKNFKEQGFSSRLGVAHCERALVMKSLKTVPSALSSKSIVIGSERIYSKSQTLINQFWSCFSHMLTCFTMQTSSTIHEQLNTDMRITLSGLRTGMLEMLIRRVSALAGRVKLLQKWQQYKGMLELIQQGGVCGLVDGDDGVTLARVQKLLHEAAALVPILEHLDTVSNSTMQLWSTCALWNKTQSDASELLPFHLLNSGSRLSAPEIAQADRSIQSAADLQRVKASLANCVQLIKEVQGRCYTVCGLPFLRCDDFSNLNDLVMNLFDNVAGEMEEILKKARCEYDDSVSFHARYLDRAWQSLQRRRELYKSTDGNLGEISCNESFDIDSLIKEVLEIQFPFQSRKRSSTVEFLNKDILDLDRFFNCYSSWLRKAGKWICYAFFGDQQLKLKAQLAALIYTKLVDLIAYLYESCLETTLMICDLYVIFCQLCAVLYEQGFAVPPSDAAEPQEGEVKDQQFEDAGLGTGEGAQDVSEQIEFEHQVQGLAGEEQAEPQSMEDVERPIEMEDNFDGVLENLPTNNKDDENDESDENENDEDQDLKIDMEMDSVSDEEAERQFDPGSVDENDKTRPENFDNSTEGANKLDDQLVAKEEQEAECNESGDQNMDNNSEEGEQIYEVPELNANASDNDDRDEKGEKEERKEEEEDDDDDEEVTRQDSTDDGHDEQLMSDNDLTEQDDQREEQNDDDSEQNLDDDTTVGEQSVMEEKLFPQDGAQQSQFGFGAQVGIDEEQLNDEDIDVGCTETDLQSRNDDIQQNSTVSSLPDRSEMGSSVQNQSSGRHSFPAANVQTFAEPYLKRRKIEPAECEQRTVGDLSKNTLTNQAGALESSSSAQVERSASTEAEEGREQANAFAHAADLDDDAMQIVDTADLNTALNKTELPDNVEEMVFESADEGEKEDEEEDVVHDQIMNDRNAILPQGSVEIVHDDEIDDNDDQQQNLDAEQNPKDEQQNNGISSFHTDRMFYCQTDNNNLDVKDVILSVDVDSLTNTDSWKRSVDHWKFLVQESRLQAVELCESLRCLLEPTVASRLQGDYRTGKRLNLRKIIPYIASGFRKDKIWLRRTRKTKRDYQVVLAIDNSQSMQLNNVKTMALQSLAMLNEAFHILEIGHVGVCRFGSEPILLQPLAKTFDVHYGARIIEQLKCNERQTDVLKLLQCAASFFTSQPTSSDRTDNGMPTKLMIILSDGRNVFNVGEQVVKDAVRSVFSAGIFVIYIIVDNNSDDGESVSNHKMVVVKPNGEVEFVSYIDRFCFPFYITLNRCDDLPKVISEALKQWIELVAEC
ncbi:Midasin [Trichinella papuae]|uniref:Midasin n=1 Tax=Trichinella papuae TaxID=268474 RepID=A0A0V1NAA0_9BILA|nr:Midasin [Trichinella papuae]